MGLSLSCLSRERANTQSSGCSVAAFTPQRPMDIDTSHPPDFSIIAGEETIPVHRHLLQEASHYFYCLFECGIHEVETRTLEVKNMKADVVRTVISYINGEDISIAWDDITDFIDIAELLQLVQLKDNIEDNIVINVDSDTNNCIHWMDIAEKYHMEKLQGKILNLDACTKLRVCLHVIQNDDASSTSNYMDSLHRFKLTQCTPAFIEVVLKKTFRKAKRAQVKPYTDMLLRVCREKTAETDNEESASFSNVPADNSLITNERHVYLCGNTRSSVSIDKVSDGKSYVNYNYKTQILYGSEKILSQAKASFSYNALHFEIHFGSLF